jgi:hypothetical protein
MRTEAKQFSHAPVRTKRSGLAWLCTAALLCPGSGRAQDHALAIEFQPRTPEQMQAFYSARGFPQPMVALLAKQCFITVRVHNTSDRVVWLELADWRFSAGGKALHRRTREEWKSIWAEMEIPLASQSTFRWTLLPESLDFQPGEREGGNIILPPTVEPIRLQAQFATGSDRHGAPLRRSFDHLRCEPQNR